MNFESIQSTLIELKNVLSQVKEEDYSKPIPNLSGSSIGEHSRHILELFQCVINGYDQGRINYDNRERNHWIQTNPKIATITIDSILEHIEKPNKTLVLEQKIAHELANIPTNYYREMLYNLEHCIHHQALLKVAILDFDYITLEANFGVAPSTIEYRKECAQ